MIEFLLAILWNENEIFQKMVWTWILPHLEGDRLADCRYPFCFPDSLCADRATAATGYQASRARRSFPKPVAGPSREVENLNFIWHRFAFEYFYKYHTPYPDKFSVPGWVSPSSPIAVVYPFKKIYQPGESSVQAGRAFPLPSAVCFSYASSFSPG